MSKKNKNKVNVVYSTNPNFNYQYEETEETETLAPEKQKLRVLLDKKNRAGKSVTLVTGFIGKKADLDTLGKMLKNKCGAGGSVKEGEIIIQGDFRNIISETLQKAGYKVTVI